MSYWVTVEYIGAGFVLQRLKSHGSDDTHFDGDVGTMVCSERIIHIKDTDSIDTSTIDMERLPDHE